MLLKQRILGVIVVLLSIFLFFMAIPGTTIQERDIGGAIFILPLGIYALTTKEYILHKKKATSEADTSTSGMNQLPPTL